MALPELHDVSWIEVVAISHGSASWSSPPVRSSARRSSARFRLAVVTIADVCGRRRRRPGPALVAGLVERGKDVVRYLPGRGRRRVLLAVVAWGGSLIKPLNRTA